MFRFLDDSYTLTRTVILRDVSPVPPFTGKFYGVSFCILLELVPIAPDLRLDAVGIFVTRWNGQYLDVFGKLNHRFLGMNAVHFEFLSRNLHSL